MALGVIGVATLCVVTFLVKSYKFASPVASKDTAIFRVSTADDRVIHLIFGKV